MRAFGAASVDWLAEQHPTLLAAADPRESVMRFQVMRQSFFDFPAVEVLGVSDSDAQLQIAYRMSPKAEEAASVQTMGFFVRLVELAGGKNVQATFASRSWAGDAQTLLELTWDS